MHSCARFNITKFEKSFAMHSISIVKSPEFILIFWEFSLIWVSFFIFEIIVKDVNGFRFKESTDFWIFMNHIS